MRRRQVLAGVPALVAGCSGLDGATAPDATATATGTPSPTRVPEIDCAAAERPPPEADPEDEVEPQAYPGEPDEPDGDWALAHEAAYRRNEVLGEWPLLSWHGLRVEDRQTEPVGTGVVARFRYTYGYQYDSSSGPVVVDSGFVTAAYYVDDRGARRRVPDEPTALASVDPVADGEPVVCF